MLTDRQRNIFTYAIIKSMNFKIIYSENMTINTSDLWTWSVHRALSPPTAHVTWFLDSTQGPTCGSGSCSGATVECISAKSSLPTILRGRMRPSWSYWCSVGTHFTSVTLKWQLLSVVNVCVAFCSNVATKQFLWRWTSGFFLFSWSWSSTTDSVVVCVVGFEGPYGSIFAAVSSVCLCFMLYFCTGDVCLSLILVHCFPKSTLNY